ncbi:MAG: rod shape-determining protein [Candidatus Margulisbacteria bacterium]|nr:rod shape-determining protein [Candidatus Margulisiibacteriota bacterium]
MLYKDTLISLDVGTNKSCAIVAGFSQTEGWKTLGIGISGSAGIKKGRLVQPAHAVNSIQLALKRAQEAAKFSAKKVLLSLPMSVCHSFWNQQSISFYDTRKVNAEDILMLQKKLENIPLNKNIHLIKNNTHNYLLDNKSKLSNSPLGRETHTIEATSQIFYIDEPDLIHWTQLLKTLGFEQIFFNLALEGLAQATLPPLQRQAGSILIDLGGGIVQIGIIQGDKLIHGAFTHIAGNHVLADIMYGVNVPAGEARRLLFEYGQAQAPAKENEMITILGDSGEEKSQVSKEYFYKIINSRLEELFSFIQEKLIHWERENVSLPTTVFLSGGLSLLPGISKIAEKILKRKIILPQKKKQVVFQTAEGALQIASDKITPQPSLIRKTLKATKSWFKEFVI